MLAVLKEILCAILSIPAAVVGLLIQAFNLVIVAVAAAIRFFLGLLPEMPDAPPLPGGEYLQAIQYVFPLVPIASFCALALVVWAAFMALKIALNWLRAL